MAAALIDPTGAPPDAPRAEGAPLEARILDAAVEGVAEVGLRGTTVDDIARRAGCSRATVYRTFPGGREALFQAAALRQLDRFAASVDARLATVGSVEDLLVEGITGAARFFADHGALRHLIEHEPELLVPQIAFDRLDQVFDAVGAFATPHLARFLPPDRAGEVAEWVTRIVLSYLFVPRPDLDLTDAHHARRLVQAFVLPGLDPAGPA